MKKESTTAMTKTMQMLLKAISFNEVNVEMFRHLTDLKRLDPLKIFFRTTDEKIYNGDHEVPVRIFYPTEEAYQKGEEAKLPVLLFLHGGGWVTEHIDNYERVCARLALSTGYLVVAVEYRLAPEHKFPAGLLDCYAVARALYVEKKLLYVEQEDITLVGDSAGGNLAAALSLLAKAKGEFMPKRQILIYPAVDNDYGEDSKYPSVIENGTDYLLTRGKLQDYIRLYASCEEDRKNPYFSPIYAKDLEGQPETLILTAEFDPLRDEGEVYGQRLKEAGNCVTAKRIAGALHGYFALGIRNQQVRESLNVINQFLKGEEECLNQKEDIGED